MQSSGSTADGGTGSSGDDDQGNDTAINTSPSYDTAGILQTGSIFFHPDYTGNISYTTNAKGDVLTRMIYRPYGQIALAGEDTFRSKFNSHEQDKTGLQFFNARYYDPELGRFAQADPTVPDPTNSQCFNRYMFVCGNPITFVDMNGYQQTTAGNQEAADAVNGEGKGDTGPSDTERGARNGDWTEDQKKRGYRKIAPEERTHKTNPPAQNPDPAPAPAAKNETKNSNMYGPGHNDTAKNEIHNDWSSAQYNPDPRISSPTRDKHKIEGITVKRNEPFEDPIDDFGHYWVEIDINDDGIPDESYGFWPEDRFSGDKNQTLKDVLLNVKAGVVKGGKVFDNDGDPLTDYDHGEPARHVYDVYGTHSKEYYVDSLRKHAKAYGAAKYRYGIPFGKTCQTFQNEWISKNKLSITER